MLRNKNEKKDKEKYEFYYVYKIEDLYKLNIQWKALIIQEEDNGGGNIEVWSTNSED